MKKIKSLDRIMKLANEGKAVFNPRWKNPCSAAFVVGMPLRVVDLFIKSGSFFEYKKEK